MDPFLKSILLHFIFESYGTELKIIKILNTI